MTLEDSGTVSGSDFDPNSSVWAILTVVTRQGPTV